MRIESIELDGDRLMFDMRLAETTLRRYIVPTKAMDRRLGVWSRSDRWPRAYNSYVAYVPGQGYRIATESGMVTLSREEIGLLVREWTYLDEVSTWTPQVWARFYDMRAEAKARAGATA